MNFVVAHLGSTGRLGYASGPDGTMVDTAGFTAMHFAAAYGHIRIIVLLNQFDKELVGQRDRRGQTALQVIAVGLEQHNRRAQETVPGSQLVDRGYAQGEF